MPDIIGATGFNYTKNWGSQLGQKGSFNFGGSRPPAKTDWDAMSQEERDAVGVPTWDDWQRAANAWQKRSQEGGDIYNENLHAAEAIQKSGASDWEGVRKALLGAGFSENIGENAPLFKQLAMQMQGMSDPTGRYHWNGNSWVDVGTSDLSKRGVAGAADYNAPRAFGIDALRIGGSPVAPGLNAFQKFKEWNRGVDEAGNKGKPGAGLTPLGNGFYRAIHGQLVDDLGYVYDPSTMQRVGHYIPGSGADISVGGKGMSAPNAPANNPAYGSGSVAQGEPAPPMPENVPQPLLAPGTNDAAWGVGSNVTGASSVSSGPSRGFGAPSEEIASVTPSMPKAPQPSSAPTSTAPKQKRGYGLYGIYG